MVSVWSIFDIHSGRRERCEIVQTAAVDFQALRESWTRAFQMRRSDGCHDDDSLLWERGFLSPAGFPADTAPRGYVVRASEEAQGVVLLEREPRSSRTCPTTGVAYVSYLASAPWNRRGDNIRPPRYQGTGRLLVVLAVKESFDLACHGHVGLHSFAVAAAFYARLGFHHFGPDPAQRGMPYFELSGESARQLWDEVKE